MTKTTGSAQATTAGRLLEIPPLSRSSEFRQPEIRPRQRNQPRNKAKLRNALIFGAGNAGRAVAHALESNKELGYSIVGFLDDDHRHDPRILGKTKDLPGVAQSHAVDAIFFTVPPERELLSSVAACCVAQRIDIHLVPEAPQVQDNFRMVEYLGPIPLVTFHREPKHRIELIVKRVLDISAAALCLVIMVPFLPFLALAIELDSRGPLFYRSTRVGKCGRFFTCYKLRTMVPDADSLLESVRHLNEREGLLFKISDDPRTTRLGRFFRKYSIDELPQLWNVLRGDMSLVGPRPPLVREYREYNHLHLARLAVTPGITGLWQIKERLNPSFETYLALDLQYIRNWSLWMDLKILLQTIPAALKGSGQ